MKKINLDDIISEFHFNPKDLNKDDILFVKTCMKRGMELILELASKNARISTVFDPSLTIIVKKEVNKQSILNTINQIK